MPWIQLRLSADEETAEKYSDWLMACGAQAVTFIDAKDTPIYEPLPGDDVIYWSNTVVMGLYDASYDMDKAIAYLQGIHPDKKAMRYKLEQLEDKDWEREWMDNFHPMKFGERLWICPSWRDIPEPDAVNVMLDPGLAFGTGTHPTTALCLEWLEGLDLTGKTVIVIGAGLAGLCSGMRLARAGATVKILEATERPGGRSLTLRNGSKYREWDWNRDTEMVFEKVGDVEPDDDDNYLNAGPGRIPQHHARVLDYCKDLNVELQPYLYMDKANLMQNDAWNEGHPVQARRLKNDLRGHLAELMAKASDQGALDQLVDPADAEAFLEMLTHFGQLSKEGAQLVYAGAATQNDYIRAGYSIDPGDVKTPGVPWDTLSLDEVMGSDFWNSEMFNDLEYFWQTSLMQPVNGMDMIWKGFLNASTGDAGYDTVESLIHTNQPVQAIDINDNTGLLQFDIANNDLMSLDIRNNTLLANMDIRTNPNLTCVLVTDVDAANSNAGFNKDPGTIYSLDCLTTVTAEFSQTLGEDFEANGGNLPKLLVTGTITNATSITVQDITTDVNVVVGEDYTFNNPTVINIPIGVYDGTLNTAIDIPGLAVLDDVDFESRAELNFQLNNFTGDITGFGSVTTTAYNISNDDYTAVVVATDLEASEEGLEVAGFAILLDATGRPSPSQYKLITAENIC